MKFFWKKNIQPKLQNGQNAFFSRQLQQMELAQKAAIIERWEYCRGLFHSPILPEPHFGPPPPGYRGAHHNLATGQTWIDLEFVKEIAIKGKADFQLVLSGLMIRQIACYMKFPRTIANAVIAEKVANDLCKREGMEFARFLANSFSSLCVDCCCVLEADKADAILELRRAISNANPSSRLDRIVLAYLHAQARREEAEFVDVEREVEILKGADFTAVTDDVCELRRAMMIWKRVVLMAQQAGTQGIFGLGKRKDGPLSEMLGNHQLSDIDQIPLLGQLTKAGLKKVLAEAALKLSWKEFAEVETMVLSLVGQKQECESAGIGWAEGVEADMKTVRRYLSLLENYPVVIEKMPIEAEGWRKVIKGTERFCIDSPIYKVMPYTSGGKILPGITRMMGTGLRKRMTLDYKAPDALIMIDSSDSMPHPAQTKSAAVAAAIATAKAYMSLGSEVAVINFGPKSYYLDYTRKEEAVFLSIVAKQHGGTKLDLELAKKLIAQAKGKPLEGLAEKDITKVLSDPEFIHVGQQATVKEVQLVVGLLETAIQRRIVDVFIFSDMKIANKEEVLKLISENSSTNRFVIVCSGQFGQKELLSSKVKIYEEVNDVEEGIKIAIGEARNAAGYN
ncbi:MAG: hypothetical protein QXT25_04225 [Candidatus Anstonellaceae archaeon]